MKNLTGKPVFITLLIGLVCALMSASCTPTPPVIIIMTFTPRPGSPLSAPTDTVPTNAPPTDAGPTETPSESIALTSAPTTTSAPKDTPTQSAAPTSTPTLPSPITATAPAATHAETACPWIPYSDKSADMPKDCPKSANGITVSDDAKKISFLSHLSTSVGMYGVCQDISAKENLTFRVAIRDNSVSARFFIVIGSDPIPNKKLTAGFRMQPDTLAQGEKDMWISLVEYVADGYENSRGKIRAIPEWKPINFWNLDFDFQFNGSTIYASMNKKALSREWQVNAASRYLCFAYQQAPTATRPTDLEVQVTFP